MDLVNKENKYFCVSIETNGDEKYTIYKIYDSENDKYFELDSEMYHKWLESGLIIEVIDTERKEKMTLSNKSRELAKRLGSLPKVIEEGMDNKEVVNYASIRASVIAGANAGFQEAKEIYMSNQGVYKHFDGSTTVIDIDGFYKNDLGGYQDIIDALNAIAEDIEKSVTGLDAEPITGINDKEYNIDRLLDISSESLNKLMHQRIIPIIIQCKSDKYSDIRVLKHTMFLKPVYEHHDELMSDLKDIYRIAKNMAVGCIK